MYVDNVADDSSDPTKYTWTLIKGQDGKDGVAGTKGADGKTPYFHTAWATNSTGTTGFSTTDSLAKTYLGTYTDYIQADSSDPSLYSWSLIQGPKGDKGDTGPQGPTGATGLQGTKGDQGIAGPAGTSSYTHIAYATNSNGTSGFSVSDNVGKTYIGMYVDQTATDSTDPTKYKWNLIKGSDGAQGIQGPKGADGLTPYWHTAYANSADGKTDFSLTVSDGKRYIGQYTDYVSADSTDPTKYKWVDMTGNVSVGGTNLLANLFLNKGTSNRDFTLKAWGQELVSSANLPSILQAGQTYTFSFNAEIKNQSSLSNTHKWVGFTIQSSTTSYRKNLYLTDAVATGKIYSFKKTFKIPEDFVKGIIAIYTNRYSDGTIVENDNVNFRNIKLEKGNIATDWSPAPEDIDAKIDTKADSELTQDQLNLLLETQNLMTAELKAKATAEQVDALIASYNKYVSDESINKANVEAELIANAERIEAFRKDYDEKMLQLDFVSNYMRATDLGLEVSASDGSSSLLVQKDRISMFSAGKEVMYISQGLIHIDNGVFTKTLQIGNFRESQADGDATTNVTIYVG